MKRIALLYGGESEEHDVSIMGHKYMLGLLENVGYDVISVYIDRSGDWYISKERVFPYRSNDGGILLAGRHKLKIDAAIPLLHGDGGESGEIQGLLKSAAIPFVGSDVSSGAICLDKHYTKCIAEKMGIPLVKWVVFPKEATADEALAICEDKLPFPIFLKPRRLGSSVGIYRVNSRDEFKKIYPIAHKTANGLLMAEELVVNKRELECAFYSARGVTKISEPGEILIDGFYGYDEKYVRSAGTLARASVSDSVKKEAKYFSMMLAEACNMRHLGRIDYFLSDGKLLFNEINTFPGFTEQSLYPKMLMSLGIDPGEALKSFIEDAIGC